MHHPGFGTSCAGFSRQNAGLRTQGERSQTIDFGVNTKGTVHLFVSTLQAESEMA